MAVEEIRAAIAAEDWPGALIAALARWRIERTVELAELIDRITARCKLPEPPHTRAVIQRWWVAQAVSPDPVMIGSLLARFAVRQYACDEPLTAMQARWPGNPVIEGVAALSPPSYLVTWAANRGETLVVAVPNWVERVAAICTWPDDPRITHVLGALVCDTNATIQAEDGDGPWPAIAERLRTLRDPRLPALLEKRGVVGPYRAARQRTLQALRDEPPAKQEAPDAEIASMLPALELPDVHRELAPLWQEVANHPDDDNPRLVLADALLAAGDNRGELIVLQCAPDPDRLERANVQAHRLISREWKRWMGDLALVLTRRGTEMRRGMLEAIRVGNAATPPWAWEAIEGHRELGAVREVRPAQIAPKQFAKLVAGLPRFPRMLHVDAHEVIEALLATHDKQPVEEIYFAPINNQMSYRRPRPLFQDTFRMLARLAPDLQRLDLGALWWHGGEFRAADITTAHLVEMIELVKSLFPRLARIRIETHTLRADARATVQEIAKVELAATKLSF